MVQGELFREDNGYEPQIGARKSFLSKYQLTLRLDKVLLLLIAMIFAFTLSHSFGVERGKRFMEKKFKSLIPAQAQTFSQTDPLNDPSEVVESETVLMVGKPTVTGHEQAKADSEQAPSIEGSADAKLSNSLALNLSDSIRKDLQNQLTPSKSELKKLGDFTVQLVTYDNKSLADKEITRLKSKGYEGFIIPSGRFYQVCTNYFDNKSKARSQLEELKQTGRYPDAYVRPVIR